MSTNMTLTIDVLAADMASSVMSKIGSAISGIGGPAGVAAGAVLALGTAAAAVGAASVQAAAQYQQSMNMVQALTGSNTQQMQAYDASVKALAVDAGVAPNDLAQGLYNVLSAGKSGADAMNVLKLATQDAKIGMTDATTTTAALTNVLNSFSVKAQDTTRVNGEMLQTVTLGKATFQQYATTIVNAASASVQFGVNMETMNAAWATLTSSGISAAHATTDYSQSLRVMYGNIGKVTDSLHKNGIAFNENKFNAMSYGDKVQYLNAALDMARAKHVAITGATQQAAQAIQTIAQHIGTYNSDLASLSNKQAMAQKTQQAWAITQQGFNQQLSQLQAAFSVLMITIGTRLLPVLGQLLGWITPLISGFNAWITGGMQVSGVMLQVGQVLASLFLPIWQQLVDLFNQQLVPLWGQLVTAITPLMPEIQLVAMVVGGVLYASFVLVIATIRAVIGAFAGLLSGVGIVIQGISLIIQGGMQYISATFTFFIDLFTGKWNKLGTDLSNIWAGITKMFAGAWQAIAGIFVSAINALIGLVNGFIQGVMSGINAVIVAMHGTAVQVGRIPMLNGVNIAAGNFSGAFTPVATSSSGNIKGPNAPPSSGAQAIVNQLKALQNQQSNLSAQNTKAISTSNIPTIGAINAASGKSGKSAAALLKQQQAAQAAQARLAATQQKALTASNSPAVQALVNQSMQAAAQGNTAMAKFYASQASSLATQQKHAATTSAHKAQSAAHHKQVLAAQAARKAQAAQHHQQIQAAAAAKRAATAQHRQQVAAAKAAKKTQTAANHKELIKTIQQSTNQITSSQCPDQTMITSAAGVALPDYATGTAYSKANPQPQAAPLAHEMHIHVHLGDRDDDDDRRARKVADAVKKELGKRLRGQGNAPRFTSGGH